MGGPDVRRLPTAWIIGAALAVYLFFCARIFLASRIDDRAGIADLQRNARLEPGNASHWHAMGRFYYSAHELSAAIESYRRAASLNPRDAYVDLDLANVYLNAGQLTLSKRALAQALRSDPTTPQVLWLAANSYIAAGDLDSALPQLAILAAHAPRYLPLSIELAWRTTRDAKTMLAAVLPAAPGPQLEFLDFLMTQDRWQEAAQVWSSIVSLKEPFAPRRAFPYVDALINRGEGEEALGVWKGLAAADASFANYLPSGNLMVNSGFQEPPLNAGFDWRYQEIPEGKLSIERGAGEKDAALAIALDGAVSEVGVSQYVNVQPGRDYVFSFRYRTSHLRGTGGVRWMIMDTKRNALLWRSGFLSETVGWKESSDEFSAGSQTNLLLVKLVREPAGNIIQGKFWVDDVRLVATPSQIADDAASR